jgi:hypothetical protein
MRAREQESRSGCQHQSAQDKPQSHLSLLRSPALPALAEGVWRERDTWSRILYHAPRTPKPCPKPCPLTTKTLKAARSGSEDPRSGKGEEWAETHSSVALPLQLRLQHHPTFWFCHANCQVSASFDALPSASEFAHWFAELGPA